jgi:secreted trypsin-like serine protease
MPSDNSTCDIQKILPKPSITSGNEAVANSWPSVSFVFAEKHVHIFFTDHLSLIACLTKNCSTGCGAVSIDKNHVITAAHCVKTTDVGNIVLVAGAHNLSSTTETIT